MKKSARLIMVSTLMASMAGCAMTPNSIVEGPTTAKPERSVAASPANGAIFQAAAYRPMFEDRRARMIGDILTIVISESTSAEKAAGNSASKTGSTEAAVPTLFGVPAATTAKFGLSGSNSAKFEEKGATSASNSFSGSISATVIDVLANGNLVVSGEKQIAFDKGSEFVRFSGVVSPDKIATGNTVLSTQVADARVEYRTNSHLDKTEIMSLFTRFFLSLVPL